MSCYILVEGHQEQTAYTWPAENASSDTSGTETPPPLLSVRECGPEAPDVTPTRVPKECGYGNFTRRSRTGSVVVCVAPSPARGILCHKPLTHRVGLATCLAGVGHTPIPSPSLLSEHFNALKPWCSPALQLKLLRDAEHVNHKKMPVRLSLLFDGQSMLGSRARTRTSGPLHISLHLAI